MEDEAALKHRIKELMIENLMLPDEPDDISDDGALFGPESLGLDSVDGLQLVVMLEKNFDLKIGDQEIARQVLQSVNHMADAIRNGLPKEP
ncbi:MAG: acyl carrier protein [Limisphaerales bacterium]